MKSFKEFLTESRKSDGWIKDFANIVKKNGGQVKFGEDQSTVIVDDMWKVYAMTSGGDKAAVIDWRKTTSDKHRLSQSIHRGVNGASIYDLYLEFTKSTLDEAESKHDERMAKIFDDLSKLSGAEFKKAFAKLSSKDQKRVKADMEAEKDKQNRKDRY